MGVRLRYQAPIAGCTTRGRDHDVTQCFETASFIDDTFYPSVTCSI